jgi:RNA polymerase sigma factor (sigma-70 family)
MEATTSIEAIPGAVGSAPGKASRLRVPASDERLVKRIRAGSEEAFATLYERYQRRLLSFCRHMLGSQAEAEDAVQQCFVNAHRDIMRGEKELRVRPWLYRIARNQCISVLRARRFDAELDPEQLSFRGLSEEVAERTDLQHLLRDLSRLPHDQREALVLAELNDNSHAEVAAILGCDREKVKSLVFQARSSLIKSREARALPCAEVQRQLSVLRGGSLRRTQLRRHLGECPACRAFHENVKRQRAALAVALPVVPSASLKFGVGGALAAAKAGAGSAATGAAATGAGSSGVATGSAATLAAKVGASGSAIKGVVAAVAVTAAVGGAGVEVVKHRIPHRPSPSPARTAEPRPDGAVAPAAQQQSVEAGRRSRPAGAQTSSGRSGRARGALGGREQRNPLGRRHRAGGRPLEAGGRGAHGRGALGGLGERVPGTAERGRGHLRPERLGDGHPAVKPRPLGPERTGPSATEPDLEEDGSSLQPE